MMVALNTTGYAANKLAGGLTPNLPSYLGCMIARLVGLRGSLVRDLSTSFARSRGGCVSGCGPRVGDLTAMGQTTADQIYQLKIVLTKVQEAASLAARISHWGDDDRDPS